MKRISFILTALIMIGFMTSFNSCCSDDDPTPDKPTITVPAGIQNVVVSGTKDLTFSIVIPGGFKSYAVTAHGGQFAVPEQMDIKEGDTSGTISGTFTAGDIVGAGSVTLTVTDRNNKTDTQTITLNITTVSPS